MSKSAYLIAAALAASSLAGAAAAAQTAAGDWSGTLRGADGSRHIAVHIHQAAQGGYVGTLESPEQPGRVPLTSISGRNDTLAFSAPGFSYQGKWDAAAGAWRGAWKEANASQPLSLKWNTDRLSVTH
jgi:hypothetical protein